MAIQPFSMRNTQENEMSTKPFFMRFVERQDKQPAEQVRTNVKAGAEDDKGKDKARKQWEKGYETFKYPSDSDEPVAEW